MKFTLIKASTVVALIFIQIVPTILSDIVWPPFEPHPNDPVTEIFISLKNNDDWRPDLENLTSRRSSCKCGLSPNRGKVNRIVGGSAAQIHSIPWRCALFYEDSKKTKKFYCGCSIIDQSWAITAAHCTNAFNLKAKFFVDVGDHDLSTTAETKNRFIPVKAVKQHEKFNRITLNNDISLLQLSSPVTDEDNASPVCLPFKFQNKTFDTSVVTVSGWGVTKEGNRVRPAVLQKADLKVISPQQCRRYNYYGKIKITDQMICTYLKGADACQGDSGSSIDYYDEETRRSYALGVVSFGRGCGRTSPGVFARLTSFLPWIKANSVGATFCED